MGWDPRGSGVQIGPFFAIGKFGRVEAIGEDGRLTFDSTIAKLSQNVLQNEKV